MRPSSVRLVKETKITQKNGRMTKAPTSSAAGVMNAAPARPERREKRFTGRLRAWEEPRPDNRAGHREVGRQSLLTVFSSPTISVTEALNCAMASSGLISPETTASVMRWIAAETSL